MLRSLLLLLPTFALVFTAELSLASVRLQQGGATPSSNAPKSLITEPARLDQAIFGRALATCGYISGNPALPLTCPAGYTCTSTVGDFVGWGCCNSIECQGNYRTCVNNGAQLCGENLGDAECSSIYTSILSCSSDNPYCFCYVRSTSVGAFQTDSSLGCGQNTSDVLALATTTGGSGGHSTITSVSFGGGSIDQPLVASTGGAIGSSPTSTSGSTVEGSSGGSSGSSSNDLSKGAQIALATALPGAGVLVAAIVGWNQWSRRKSRQRRVDSGHQMSTMQGPGGYGGGWNNSTGGGAASQSNVGVMNVNHYNSRWG